MVDATVTSGGLDLPAGETAKAEVAYRRLKTAILAGEYGPNERLVEAPLTSTLGVSRNTLRTVLARLDHEGLIVLEPNRGGRVRSFTLEEADDTLTVREAVEGLVGELAARRATQEQKARLRAVQEEMERALDGDDLIHFGTLSGRFHSVMIEAAASPRANAVLESLYFPMIRFQFQTVLVPGRKANVVKEHEALLRAIEEGDARAAGSAARRHVRQIRAALARCEPFSAAIAQ